jgi:uncharacterized protein (TIGR02246 family)
MTNPAFPRSHGATDSDEAEARALYQRLLDSWNRRQAGEMAALFTEDGSMVGFDGSPINGRAEIERTLGAIFADHPTAAYVGLIREVRFLTPEVALVRSVAGMVPPGGQDLNPAVNTIQSMVAVRTGGQWRIAIYQNTPAQFHGRPELARQLTEELKRLL